MQTSRSVLRYRQKGPGERQSQLVRQLRQVTLEHPQYGYRKAHAVLVRQGLKVNAKTVHRLWKLHHLQQKPRRHHRKVRSGASLPEKASQVNEVWALDFVFDQTVGGQPLKFLTLTDEYSKMLLSTRVSTRFRAEEVIKVLNQAFAEHGRPQKLRSDNGSEFVARDLGVFLGLKGVTAVRIEPGKPWQNGFIESLNSRFREEFLNQHVFRTVKEAQVLSESYRQYFNQQRVHSSLGYLTPCEFVQRSQTAGVN